MKIVAAFLGRLDVRRIGLLWLGWAALGVTSQGQAEVDRAVTGGERRILVAFRDGSIDRIPVGDGAGGYRRRGHYDSSTWGQHSVADLGQQYRMDTVDQWPIPVLGMHCAVFRVPDGASVTSTLDALAADDRVDLAEQMRTFRVQAGATGDPYGRLQAAWSKMNLSAAHRYATGRNVEVAVVDTGVDTQHPDLATQISDTHDFTEAKDDAAPDMHGTAVAGLIAAAAGNGVGISGVAPSARIVSLKACWPDRPDQPEAVCDTFTLAQALNTAIARKVKLVNLSLAGPRDPLLERLIAVGQAQGMIFVSSLPPDGSAQAFPASAPGVIAVRSAGAAPAPLLLASRSITAPGAELLTTLPQGTYNFVTGSSYATAVVSGVIALMLERQPELERGAILGLLRGAAIPAANMADAPLNACGVLVRLGAAATCPSEPPSIASSL